MIQPHRSLSRWTAAALPVLLAGLLAVFPLHNDDAGFHLATGRVVLQTGHVPLTNPFSYAHDGATWIQHQWLPAVAMTLVVDAGGIRALVLVKALVVALAFALAAWTMWRQRTGAAAIALWLVLGVTASAFRFLERPFLASILALALVTHGLWLWWQTGERKWLWLAALTPVVAVHLHAGALDGLLVWVAAVGAAVVDGMRGAGWQRLRGLALPLATLLLLVVLGLWLLAPAGLALLSLPFAFSQNGYWHEHLAEFRPLPLDATSLPQLPLLAAMLVALILAVRARHAFAVLLLAGFLALGLRHVRMIWPMAVVAMPVGASLTSAWLTGEGRRSALTSLLAVVLALAGAADQHAAYGLGLTPDGVDHRRLPLAQLDKAAQLPGHTFVSDGLAGTWLWREFALPDQHQVLIHNCLECYRESTYRAVYQAIRYGAPDWAEQAARLGIRTFLLKHTSPGERRFQAGTPNVRQLLYRNPAWVLVDWDDTVSLYTQRASLPANTPTLADFPVDPDTGVARTGVAEADVQAALRHHAATHPQSTRSLDMLARRLARLGQSAAAADVAAEITRRAQVDRHAAQ